MCGIFGLIYAIQKHSKAQTLDFVLDSSQSQFPIKNPETQPSTTTSTQIDDFILYSKHLDNRGPDSHHHISLTKSYPKYFLYHSLLSIIGADSSGSTIQPLEFKSWRLICNGEIYNHHSLRNQFSEISDHASDCMIIPQLFDHFSPIDTKSPSISQITEVLNLLDGIFSMILVDLRRSFVLIARDPMGVNPLFCGFNSNFIVASSIIDPIPLSTTHCTEIPAGHFVFFQFPLSTTALGNKFLTERIHRYIPWEFYKTIENPCETIPVSILMDEFRALLENSIRKRFLISNSVSPIGIFLSGGVDSAIICAIAKKISIETGIPIHAYSIQFQNKNVTVDDTDEIVAAKKVSQHLKIPHTVFSFNENDAIACLPLVIHCLETWDVSVVRAAIPLFLLSKKTSGKSRVVLVGEGADELFAGYQHFTQLENLESVRVESNRILELLFTSELLRVDRVTKFHGIEARVPYVDKDIISKVLKIPSIARFRIKSNNGLRKLFLRDSFKGYLPESVLNRRKIQFADSVGPGWLIFMKKQALNQNFKGEEELFESIFDNIFGKDSLAKSIVLGRSELRRDRRKKYTKTKKIDIDAHSRLQIQNEPVK